MSRRLLPRDAMARRMPLLVLSVVLLLVSFVLIGLGKPILGFTAFVGAFLAVGFAKRT